MKLVGPVWTKALVAAALATAVCAQPGTTPKSSPADYPAHAIEGSVGVGAEYMVHSFSRGEAYYIAKDYLVVEVAMFPPEGKTIEIRPADFLLRVNGRKQALAPQTPEMVAAALSHAEWRSADPHVEMAAGAGNASVIYGVPVPQRTPYPSDPSVHPVPIPQAPKDDPTGIDHTPPVKAEDLVIETALPEGAQKWPASGFLYFAYTGKSSSIKSVELVYKSTVLRLK